MRLLLNRTDSIHILLSADGAVDRLRAFRRAGRRHVHGVCRRPRMAICRDYRIRQSNLSFSRRICIQLVTAVTGKIRYIPRFCTGRGNSRHFPHVMPEGRNFFVLCLTAAGTGQFLCPALCTCRFCNHRSLVPGMT